jgi:dipeptidyl aminopeptidase/acylaminoacyl peptidase
MLWPVSHAHASDTVDRAAYARAERFLPWNLMPLTRNLTPHAVWIPGQDRFWYVNYSAKGKDFVLVDATSNRRRAAFDHEKLAATLSSVAGESYSPGNLPFDTLEFIDDRSGVQTRASVRFHVGATLWICTVTGTSCRRDADAIAPARNLHVSPDGRWAEFVRDHNLWVTSTATHGEFALTADGREYDAYAVNGDADTTAVTERLRYPDAPDVNALWSPDSGKILTYRLDESKMAESYLVQSVPPGPIGSKRPMLHHFRFPYPGDEQVASAHYVILDPQERSAIAVDLPPEEVTIATALSFGKVWWSTDSREAYVILADRWALHLKLFAIDAATGKSRLLLEERGTSVLQTSAGFFNTSAAPAVRVIHNARQAIWFSERDGWGHLYLYDLGTHAPARQITRGAWTVRDLEYVDEARDEIYFTAGGMEKNADPYLTHLYRIRLDGSHLELLTPENADHSIVFSPTGRYFVDNYSRVDSAPTTVLRDRSGRLLQEISSADIGRLIAAGWRFPEPFTATAADGMTDLYGVIFRPSNFDPLNHYPVIDSIYPGPQVIRSPKTLPKALEDGMQAQALAELGFIVITIDGRGTPLRSRAFRDFSYRNLGAAGGLADHVAAIKQLAERYKYLDADRVGIYGHSAGGFAAVRALLAYPEFYKVAVASSGNHDQRGNVAAWGETWLGPLNEAVYEEASNPVQALKAPLKGRLLLAWGDMDDNVSPFLSVQLIDSLIKTNSDFDLLVMPNCNHRLTNLNPYFIRRRWDYFVRNLLGQEPPQGYEIKGGLGCRPPQDDGRAATSH